MPPKISKETIIFVIDIGINDDTPDGKEFVDTAKEVMMLIIKKKIFLRPKDEVGIILIGSSSNQNNFNYENIEEFQSIQVVSQDTLRNIDKIKPTVCFSKNWINAVEVAIDLSNRENFSSSRTTCIMLADYLQSDKLNAKDMEKIAGSIINTMIHFLCIGSKPLKTNSEDELNKSEKMLLNLVNQVAGEYMTFNETLPSLRFFGTKEKKPAKWKCDLEICDIKIKINAYVLTKEEKAISSWEKISLEPNSGQEDPITTVKKQGELVDRHKNIVERDDVNEGYMYGREFVPITEHDVHNLKIEAQEKSLILYGFTSQDSVKIDYRTGKQTHIILPNKNEERQFFALAKAMTDKNQVGLVRKVYQKNTSPKMNILYPCVDKFGKPWCMYMYEIIYADEKSVIDPRPYQSIIKRLTKQQNDSVNNLIETMLLDDNHFQPGKIRDPNIQHMWNRLAFRAMKPDLPLPAPEDYLLKSIKSSNYINNVEFESCIKKLKEFFPIPEEEKAEILQKNNTIMDVDEVQEIPAVNKLESTSINSDSARVASVAIDLDCLFDD